VNRATPTFRIAAPILLAAAVAACAPAARPRTEPAVPPALSAAPGGSPWEIPAAALGTQRLYRVRYSGPEGEGSVKVTLRLVTAERYQVQAADPLGRLLWSLDVGEGRGLWIDHRAEVACRLGDRLTLTGVPLAPFPLLALPPLLLGRLPAPPGAGGAAAGGDDGLDFLDREGRRWTARCDGGRPESWTLWASGGDEPRISWLRVDGEAILSDREQRVQLRWREVVAEPLTGVPDPLTVPSGYREIACPD
jgi:hypothetical protein